MCKFDRRGPTLLRVPDWRAFSRGQTCALRMSSFARQACLKDLLCPPLRLHTNHGKTASSKQRFAFSSTHLPSTFEQPHHTLRTSAAARQLSLPLSGKARETPWSRGKPPAHPKPPPPHPRLERAACLASRPPFPATCLPRSAPPGPRPSPIERETFSLSLSFGAHSISARAPQPLSVCACSRARARAPTNLCRRRCALPGAPPGSADGPQSSKRRPEIPGPRG